MSLNEVDEVRRRRRGSALEVAILEAAWAELAEHGYDEFTFEGVATRAETSRAVLYRRWSGKPELTQAALKHILTQYPIALPDTGSLRGDVIDVLTRANDQRAHLATILVASLGQYYRTTGSSISDLRDTLMIGRGSAMEPIIERAIARGEIDPAKLTPRIARLPIDLFRHEVLMTLTAVAPETIVEIVDTIFLPLVRPDRG